MPAVTDAPWTGDACSLVDAFRSGERSPTEELDATFAAIDASRLNAFCHLDREWAYRVAAAADVSKPCGGVPPGIKELDPVRGWPFSEASLVFAGRVADRTGHGVERLLGTGGAVPVGSTTASEFGGLNVSVTKIHGVTHNPWRYGRTVGGSSAGSAAAVSGGLVSLATGGDGGGSIRIPAACCGLFGLKPQRGRIPTAPEIEPHRGMAEYGPLTRTVADAGRFMDAVKDGGPSLAEAASADPGRLRIAVSVALPIPGLHPDDEQRSALDATIERLRELGHDVQTREIDYGLTMGNRVLTRFVKGIGDKAEEIGHRDRLSRRARGIARIGTSIPSRLADSAAAQAADDAARINTIFEHADVVLTPMFTRRPPRVREFDGRPGWLTLIGMTRFAPYNGTFNHTGHPAVAVPAGQAPDGFPLAVQFVGPPDAEARLVSLSAQLERATDWPALRPAVAA